MGYGIVFLLAGLLQPQPSSSTESGLVKVWGDNANGKLGLGTATFDDGEEDIVPNPTPVLVPGITGVTSVTSGGHHTLALTVDGRVWAWGMNYSGELGKGTVEEEPNQADFSPALVVNLSGVKAISAGYSHSVALKTDGTVWAWGENEEGCLGNGTTESSAVPVQVINLSDVTAIAAGGSYTLALGKDGSIWAWGSNESGTLGLPWETEGSSVPVKIDGLGEAKAITAGWEHALTLLQNGTVWSWGDNSQGQLGNGTEKESLIPVKVKKLSKVKAIAAGWDYSLALLANGTVWSWGVNVHGELGDGTTISRKVPVPVQGLSGVTAIAAGANHSLALKSNQTVYSWGSDGYGELGYEEEEGYSTKPHKILNLGNVFFVAAGDDYTMALVK